MRFIYLIFILLFSRFGEGSQLNVSCNENDITIQSNSEEAEILFKNEEYKKIAVIPLESIIQKTNSSAVQYNLMVNVFESDEFRTEYITCIYLIEETNEVKMEKPSYSKIKLDESLKRKNFSAGEDVLLPFSLELEINSFLDSIIDSVSVEECKQYYHESIEYKTERLDEQLVLLSNSSTYQFNYNMSIVKPEGFDSMQVKCQIKMKPKSLSEIQNVWNLDDD
ncbi:hypothetical protein SNEBB_008673 [Seison nebaliae]|nr:hypothetical protein SNEBB_008673 [Seison nebaliae]